MPRQHGHPDVPARANTSVQEDLDDDLDDLINKTAALGNSWFDRANTSTSSANSRASASADGHLIVLSDDSDSAQPTAGRQPPPQPRRQANPNMGGQNHSSVLSSRKQMAMFNQRKHRPEHHIDNNAHRISAPSSSNNAAARNRRPDPVQTFGSMDYKSSPAVRGPNTSLAAEQEFYTDPTKASADLKALLEGGMDDDEEEEAPPAAENATSVPSQEQVEKEQKPRDPTAIQSDGYLEGLNVRLLPHQVEGVTWMKGRELGPVKRGKVPKGGILADDMGLGKTLQTLSLILSHEKPGPDSPKHKKHYPTIKKSTLVVAPLALIRQWEAEIKDKVDENRDIRVYVHHGPQRTKRPDDLTKYDVVVTTYQILVSEHNASSPEYQAGCFGVHWWRVVLDEAHTIKNRNAKATKACCALRSEFRWCLTGTPMQNNLDELQSLVCFLKIRPYDDLREWREHIDRPMKNGKGHIAIHRLHSLLRCFMKRRTKDVLKEEGALQPGGKAALEAQRKKNEAEGKPADASTSSTGFRVTQRTITPISAKFTPAEKRFYQRLEERADKSMERMMKGKLNYANALVLLLRLRQACNHPKLLEGRLENDSEAVGDTVTKVSGSSGTDVDALADLFAGVDIKIKMCSICARELSPVEAKEGQDTCKECFQDLAYFNEEQHSGKKEHKAKKSKKSKHPKAKKHAERLRQKSRQVIDDDDEEEDDVKPRPNMGKKRAQRRNVVLDSDEEEAEGSWLVPEGEQASLHLGTAGGTTDEDAEGGGDSIATEDSDHPSELEDQSKMSSFIVSGGEASGRAIPKHNRRKPRRIVDSDDNDDSDSSSGLDSESSLPAIVDIKSTSQLEDSQLTANDEGESGSDSDSSSSSNTGSEEESDEDSEDTSPEDAVYGRSFDGTQILASSKIRELLRILRGEVAEHKFIVFSQFTSMLTMVEPFLARERIRYVRYDGSMRNDEREASLKSLRSDPATRVLLCSLKCGSLGLNLTAATRVVILEPFWNPFIEEQAIDRVHRLTQTVDVVVYKLTVEATVEERILQLQDRKRALAEQAIEGGMKKGAFKLGMQEMLELFRRDGGSVGGGPAAAPARLEDARHDPVQSRPRGGILRAEKPKPVGNQESDLYGRRW
ncbi:hypothetical protein BROUX41_002317 [Berkeleyomyces rouxiae]